MWPLRGPPAPQVSPTPSPRENSGATLEGEDNRTDPLHQLLEKFGGGGRSYVGRKMWSTRLWTGKKSVYCLKRKVLHPSRRGGGSNRCVMANSGYFLAILKFT